MKVTIVQLPFPSTSDPHPAIAGYYRDYASRFAEVIPAYRLREGDVWEAPLWVAHLCGMLRAADVAVEFVDLSREQPAEGPCVERVLANAPKESAVLLSPLAQNFDLACDVSRTLMRLGRRTVIGGNMAALAEPSTASLVYRGILDLAGVHRLLTALKSDRHLLESWAPTRAAVTWTPDYSRLSHYHSRVSLLRLNASHGCLYACDFCGDAWSRKLHVVDPSVLESELEQFGRFFPETELLYIGDKTFGQSQEAVRNLVHAFESRPQYRLIVQTHINTISSELIDTMLRLRVAVVEIGFESADPDMLNLSNKATACLDRYEEVFESLRAKDIRVVLNVLGGLPFETSASHARTLEALRRWRDLVWLHNLYNFVPYPLTPYFRELRERIFNWKFAAWREDSPPVYQPYYLSPKESWEAFLTTVETAHVAIGGDPASAEKESLPTTMTGEWS